MTKKNKHKTAGGNTAKTTLPLEQGKAKAPTPRTDQEERDSKKRDALDWLGLIINALTLIAVVVYAYFACRQAAASKDAADSAKAAAVAAIRQYKIAERKEPPRIVVDGMPDSPDMLLVDDRMSLEISFRNVGRTAALSVNINVMFVSRTIEDARGEWKQETHLRTVKIPSLKPNASQTISVTIPSQDGANIERMNAGTFQIGIAGTIFYFGAFDPGRHLRSDTFCIPYVSESLAIPLDEPAGFFPLGLNDARSCMTWTRKRKDQESSD